MNVKNMRVRAKLLGSFAVVAAIVAVVSAMSLHSLAATEERLVEYVEGISVRERLVAEIRGAASRRAIAARNLV